MKKTILLLSVMLPLLVFGQKVETDSISGRYRFERHSRSYKSNVADKNASSGVLLQNASKSMKDGVIYSLSGVAIATASVLIANNSDDDEVKGALPVIGCGAGGILIIIGSVKMIQGYIDIGKAGKRLEYELGVMESKLAFKF